MISPDTDKLAKDDSDKVNEEGLMSNTRLSSIGDNVVSTKTQRSHLHYSQSRIPTRINTSNLRQGGERNSATNNSSLAQDEEGKQGKTSFDRLKYPQRRTTSIATTTATTATGNTPGVIASSSASSCSASLCSSPRQKYNSNTSTGGSSHCSRSASSRRPYPALAATQTTTTATTSNSTRRSSLGYKMSTSSPSKTPTYRRQSTNTTSSITIITEAVAPDEEKPQEKDDVNEEDTTDEENEARRRRNNNDPLRVPYRLSVSNKNNNHNTSIRSMSSNGNCTTSTAGDSSRPRRLDRLPNHSHTTRRSSMGDIGGGNKKHMIDHRPWTSPTTRVNSTSVQIVEGRTRNSHLPQHRETTTTRTGTNSSSSRPLKNYQNNKGNNNSTNNTVVSSKHDHSPTSLYSHTQSRRLSMGSLIPSPNNKKHISFSPSDNHRHNRMTRQTRAGLTSQPSSPILKDATKRRLSIGSIRATIQGPGSPHGEEGEEEEARGTKAQDEGERGVNKSWNRPHHYHKSATSPKNALRRATIGPTTSLSGNKLLASLGSLQITSEHEDEDEDIRVAGGGSGSISNTSNGHTHTSSPIPQPKPRQTRRLSLNGLFGVGGTSSSEAAAAAVSRKKTSDELFEVYGYPTSPLRQQQHQQQQQQEGRVPRRDRKSVV